MTTIGIATCLQTYSRQTEWIGDGLVLWVKLVMAASKDINGSWRIDLPIEFDDVANEENEQEFNAN
jgi:hypothetical protein